MKPSKSTLTNKLDTICSLIVRANGECERCCSMDTLQCAHIQSRRFLNTRWSLNNLLCLCAGCHFWAHQNPIFFVEWVRDYKGEENYEDLKRKAQEIKKWTIPEMQDQYEDLRSELYWCSFPIGSSMGEQAKKILKGFSGVIRATG